MLTSAAPSGPSTGSTICRLPAEVTGAIAEPWRPYRSLATSYLFTAGPEGSDEAQAAAQTGDTADQVAPREG